MTRALVTKVNQCDEREVSVVLAYLMFSIFELNESKNLAKQSPVPGKDHKIFGVPLATLLEKTIARESKNYKGPGIDESTAYILRLCECDIKKKVNSP